MRIDPTGPHAARARRAILLLLTVGLAACGERSSTEATDSARAAIEAMKATILDAFIKKDAAAIAALFADDAVVHDNTATPIIGRPAIEARIAALLPRVLGYAISSRRLEADGDLAYEQETFNLTLSVTDGGEPDEIVGFQLLVLKRQADGVWKVIESGSWIGIPEMHHDMPM